jgi:hypothetical protein
MTRKFPFELPTSGIYLSLSGPLKTLKILPKEHFSGAECEAIRSLPDQEKDEVHE